MHLENLSIADIYYTAMAKKDLSHVKQYLHENVHFIGPLAEMTGKEAYLNAAENFMSVFTSLKVRAKFASGDQVVLIYDVEFPSPIGKFPTAGLLTFQEGLIIKVELFYDARPLEQKKEDIFS